MFYVKKFVSKKSGKLVSALCADLGYTTKYISFDVDLLAELLALSRFEFANLPAGVYTVTFDPFVELAEKYQHTSN